MRRSRFGETVSRGDSDYADNTKYDEKYIMPTNAVTPDFGTSSVYAAPAQEPGQTQMFNDPMKDAEPVQSARPSFYAAQPRSADRIDSGYGSPQSVQQAEAPRVFALRSDPTLYVYEYSDRLEYYRNTPGGMLLCNIENKRR